MLVKDKVLKKSWVAGGKIHIVDNQDHRYIIENQAYFNDIVRQLTENRPPLRSPLHTYADITSGRAQSSQD
ncbi:hypothetical protein FSP39_000368 [Pinctada imbricata]|nr:hypothetical protein FSP39_000368 [Pinctada imbricata]